MALGGVGRPRMGPATPTALRSGVLRLARDGSLMPRFFELACAPVVSPGLFNGIAMPPGRDVAEITLRICEIAAVCLFGSGDVQPGNNGWRVLVFFLALSGIWRDFTAPMVSSASCERFTGVDGEAMQRCVAVAYSGCSCSTSSSGSISSSRSSKSRSSGGGGGTTTS